MGPFVQLLLRPFLRPLLRALTATALAAAVTLGVTACGGGSSSANSRTYTMQGQVLSVAPERKETVVKHEEIAGFMEAMTMPYYVRDVKELEGLAPGDLITSTLVVEGEGAAYLREVKKVGNAPIERQRVSVGLGAAAGVEMLKEGDPVPNATFIDQDGKPRDFASFKGQTVAVTFIYTKCPLPTFCPLMDRNFAKVQAKLASDPALRNVHLLTVSFDPKNDTPAVLKQHAASLQADLARWTFVTGERDAIDQFAARFGVSLMREGDAAEITHNLRTAIVNGEGTLVKVYTGNEWTPEQLLTDLAAATAAARPQ